MTKRAGKSRVRIIGLFVARGGSLVPFVLAFTLSCLHNRPDAPAIPVGPASVEVDWEHSFKTWTAGQDSGPVHFRFDWGDGQTSPWIVLGETVDCSHPWTHAGVYRVRAQVHDNRSELSEWSDPLKVTAAVPAYPYRLVDSVAIGGALYDAQVSPSGKFVYLTEMLGGVLSVVRTSDLDIVAQIPLNEGWWGEGDVQVMCSPNSGYVYVVPYSYDYVGVVRTSDHFVVDSVRLGEETNVISSAISSDGEHLYVAVDADSGLVIVLNLHDNAIEDTIYFPGACTYISSMKVAPDDSRLYAVDIGEEVRVCAARLSDYAIEWQVSDEEVSDGPGALVVHPSGSPLYVLDEERVSVRNCGNGFIVGATSLESPWSAEIAPDGSFLYVACVGTSNGALGVVRTYDNKVVRVIAMPTDFEDVAPSPDGQKLYVAGDNGKLYVLGR